MLLSDPSGGLFDGFGGSQHQQNSNSLDTTGVLYATAEGYSSTHRPNSQTVPYLEAIAAVPSSSAMSMSATQSHLHAQPEQMAFNPQSSQLSRQDSTRSFLEGPHLSTLTLDSPRNSVSAGSSTPSSSNSPTTPLSGYGTDTNLSFQHQQNTYLNQSQAGQYQPQTAFIPYAHGAYQARNVHVTHGGLSMSVPASMPRNGYEQSARNQSQTSARPHGRMSSAGLMDQIVSSRQVLASPNPEQMESASQVPSLSKESKKVLRSQASSRSKKKSPTPPVTPGRSSLRASKQGVDAGQLQTILSGHTTPTGEVSGTTQAPSSAGPHRTASKRTLSYEDAPHHTVTPAAATTPRRPSTLRRSASHTPGATLDSPAILEGLASPAKVQASQRAQTAAQFAMASAMAPAQKARIAACANLEFPGGVSGGMSRAQSSPGYALSGSYSQQQPASGFAVSPNSTNDLAKRRSNTLTSLHMSPLGLSTSRSSEPSHSPDQPISFAEALLALDQIGSFLNHQSSIVSAYPNQSTDNILGTYEQLQSIEDLKRRVQNKLAFPS